MLKACLIGLLLFFANGNSLIAAEPIGSRFIAQRIQVRQVERAIRQAQRPPVFIRALSPRPVLRPRPAITNIRTIVFSPSFRRR